MNDRLVIGGPTALKFVLDPHAVWYVRPSDTAARPSLDTLGCRLHAARHHDLERIREACAPYGTVHLYVPKAGARTKHRGFCSHVWRRPVPEGSLLLWEEPDTGLTVHVVAPALALLQTAAMAGEAVLIGAASELMGRYPHDDKGPGQPTCSRRSLLAQLDAMPADMPRLKRTQTAVELAFEGSRSALETAAAGMLSLPRDLGGLGLPRPRLNHAVHLPPAQERQLGYTPLTADLAWPQGKVLIEYQGKHHFESRRVAEDDMNRASVLRQLGWWVEQWAKHDLQNLLRLDDGGRRVAERLGRTLPEPDTGFRELQGRLYAGLTGWRDLVP